MILVDDTLWEGKWVGKGALAIPYLLSLGWKVLASGYQVLLSRVDFARSEPSDAVDEVDGLVTTRRNSL